MLPCTSPNRSFDHDVDRSKVYLVSPPFACGIAWLVNVLLHLDIRVTNPNFEPEHWISSGTKWTASRVADQHLKWHLPTLHERSEFSFPEPIEVFWEHRLNFANDVRAPTILFVRDPRDAVYSLYRRNMADLMPFPRYLNTADEWPDHFPGLFQLPPLETFSYFCLFWLSMEQEMPVKLIRFEDAKEKPVQVVEEVLSFMGLKRSSDDILAAIASSGFDSAKKAMSAMEEATGKTFKTVRKAQVGEWKSTYSWVSRLSIRPSVLEMVRFLGYGHSGPNSDSAPVEGWNVAIERISNPTLKSLTIKWSQAIDRGVIPDSAEIYRDLRSAKLTGQHILRAAAVVEAMYYVKQIFGGVVNDQSKRTFRVFASKNLMFFDERPIQLAAWAALKRLDAMHGAGLVERVGSWQRWKDRLYTTIWSTLLIDKSS